jgi:hypothetical protein
MPTLEESAAAFRAGQLFFYGAHPEITQETFPADFIDGWRSNFLDGWRSAQREAEVERHIDEGAAK